MNVSFKKTGSVVSNIQELMLNPIYEPDNSMWIQIAHHNNPASYLFSSTDTFETSVYTDSNRWFHVSLCNLVTTWELMIIQARLSTDTPEKFRWIQTANPMTATYADVALANITRITTSGYTTATGNYAGLYYRRNQISTPEAYLVCNNGTAGNWFGPVGSWTLWSSGTPAYNGSVITTGYTDLYLRIDNTDLPKKISVYEYNIISNSIIER